MLPQDPERTEHLCRLFGIPEFIIPWLDRFFEPEEFDLIHELSSGPVHAASLQTPFSNVERASQRGVINCLEDGGLELADFHARFEMWALFEGWKDLPDSVRERLNNWEFDSYQARKREFIETLTSGQSPANVQEKTEYLLLHEIEDFLRRAEHMYLWPCNCRAMMGRCPKPLYTCLRFTNSRGIGWEISHERAVDITQQAHRAGLMQLAEIYREPDGTLNGALCNCCADCCYPHLLAERLESQKIWPASRYVARFLEERCTQCGRCVRRCPFQAFRKEKGKIVFVEDQCRGCGLCATTCPEDAIQMIALI